MYSPAVSGRDSSPGIVASKGEVVASLYQRRFEHQLEVADGRTVHRVHSATSISSSSQVQPEHSLNQLHFSSQTGTYQIRKVFVQFCVSWLLASVAFKCREKAATSMFILPFQLDDNNLD